MADTVHVPSQTGGEKSMTWLLAADIWKETYTERVIKRHCRLFRDCFVTFKDIDYDPDDCKVWKLKKACKLEPENVRDIRQVEKIKRPHSRLGIGKPIDLYVFEVWWVNDRLSDWLRGDRFTFGFESEEQAQQWHAELSRLLRDAGRTSSTTGELRKSFLEVGNGEVPDSCRSSAGSIQTAGAPSLPSVGPHIEPQAIWEVPVKPYSIKSRKWVPLKHSNGFAIYHRPPSPDGANQGGEFMVSSCVKGRPVDCFNALINHNSMTTILGPASAVEVLHSEKGMQVVSILLEPPPPLDKWFAPRQAIVERRMTKCEDGIYLVLFTSIEHHTTGHTDAGKDPVRLIVNGGYTISRLKASHGEESTDSLVTLVLNIPDLGGALSPSSWFYYWNWYFGRVDAFVDSMLMGIILLKDEVEMQRFALVPTAEFGREETTAPATTQATDQVFPTPRSSTVVIRGGKGLKSRMSEGGTFLSAAKSALPEEEEEEEGTQLEEGYPTYEVPRDFWQPLHTPHDENIFSVRGPNYLEDRKKVPAGPTCFSLRSVELLTTDTPVSHVSRYLTTVRQFRAGFSFVLNIIVPGTPCLNLVAVFSDPGLDISLLDQPPEDPEEGDWTPFDYLLYKFLHGTDEQRDTMFKLIPHVAEGSWLIKQSVGTTPVIIGTKLKAFYDITSKYVEVSIDIGSNSTAYYITSTVRGAIKSLVIDMAILLEGKARHELPERLIGAVRLKHLDLSLAKPLDCSKEVPLATEGKLEDVSADV